MAETITIQRVIHASIERVFEALITPDDLVKWHNAGEGWTTPYAEVDPMIGGKIKIGYAGPDDKVAFEFTAFITDLVRPTRLAYRLGMEEVISGDDRMVTFDLAEVDLGTKVTLELELEMINDKELQRHGWTAHIDHLQKLLEVKEA
jgi:uncharacterized protein YndB with AHSA1/START domain